MPKEKTNKHVKTLMPRSPITEGYVKTLKVNEYTYYQARITIMRKSYSKTFKYTPLGLKEAKTWLSRTIEFHKDQEFNSS